MTALPEIMTQASADMTSSLAKTRAAIAHSLSKGEAVEETVRSFLRAHLPPSLGVAKGEVIDSLGNRSKQMDVIIYDAARTPILFTSEEDGFRLIPVEGVISVVEVKTSLSASDLDSVIANMKSVKSLSKTAFFRSQGPIQHVQRIYGEERDTFPVLYSVFAFEGAEFSNIASELNKKLEGSPLDQRVDNACIMGQGVILNHRTDDKIEAASSPGSYLCSTRTEHALLLWYLVNSVLLLQAETLPINLTAYIDKTFVF